MEKLALFAVLSFGVLSPAVAQTNNNTDRSMSTPINKSDDTNRTDYGWIGLLGLAGLAGLMKRKNVDNTSYRANPTTTR